MPSFFTAPIEEDPNFTFRDYALRAAFAFLMEAREGTSVKLHREPSDYNQRIWEIEAEISELEEMTLEQIEMACLKTYEENVESAQRINAAHEEKLKLYTAMREKVEGWEAPEELKNLKEFMLQQIEQSTQFMGPSEVPERQMPGDWHADRLKWARRSLEMALERKQEEDAGMAKRNRWVAALFKEFDVDGELSQSR